MTIEGGKRPEKRLKKRPEKRPGTDGRRAKRPLEPASSYKEDQENGKDGCSLEENPL